MTDYIRDWRPVKWGSGSVCTTAILGRSCPLWVKSRHCGTSNQCPLYPQKQTLELSGVMSALCQKQTFCAAAETGPIRSPRRWWRAVVEGSLARAWQRASGRRWRFCLRHCHTFVSFALAASSRKRLDSQDGITCESSGWMNFLEAASKPHASKRSQRTGRRD